MNAGIVACSNQVCNMFVWITLYIKSVEFRRSITVRHVKSVNYLGVRLYVQVGSMWASPRYSLTTFVIKS